MKEDEINPNINHYALLLTACGQTNNPEEAYNLMQHVKSDPSVKLNLVICNILISVFGNAAQFDRLDEVVQYMEEEKLKVR
eukprot:UN00821